MRGQVLTSQRSLCLRLPAVSVCRSSDLASPLRSSCRQKSKKSRTQYKLKHKLAEVEEGGDVVLRKPGHLYGFRMLAGVWALCAPHAPRAVSCAGLLLFDFRLWACPCPFETLIPYIRAFN